jgi:predicted phage tail protein
MESKDNGLTFALFIGKRNIGQDGLNDPVGDDEIRIAPIIEGSKRGGVLQTIIGVVLIVVGVVVTGMTFGGAAPLGGALVNLGIGMVVGGIVQMLSPQPKGLSAKDSPENQPSYSMNGTVNTQAAGNPVPLCYGRVKIGSALISGGIYSEDIGTNVGFEPIGDGE